MWPRKHKHLNEIQKSIQDMKLELKKKKKRDRNNEEKSN